MTCTVCHCAITFGSELLSGMTTQSCRCGTTPVLRILGTIPEPKPRTSGKPVLTERECNWCEQVFTTRKRPEKDIQKYCSRGCRINGVKQKNRALGRRIGITVLSATPR